MNGLAVCCIPALTPQSFVEVHARWMTDCLERHQVIMTRPAAIFLRDLVEQRFRLRRVASWGHRSVSEDYLRRGELAQWARGISEAPAASGVACTAPKRWQSTRWWGWVRRCKQIVRAFPGRSACCFVLLTQSPHHPQRHLYNKDPSYRHISIRKSLNVLRLSRSRLEVFDQTTVAPSRAYTSMTAG